MTYHELLMHLRSYHAFIYTGDKNSDLDLIEEEVRELFRLGIVEPHFLKDALIAIRVEREKTKR
ncbi:DUF910 family protein [Paenalkalicoccus suaedae]|uniref:DUF910 family protein n=1 Tax=Paenalkalicoccus suaedae TaxID=2592382 RepID=A0A859FDE5_9BACI|nr:YqgQ family protein [Paenalkalicoccus suaedae]QKS70920.1 DUF910 family protein [Paenalkalicoccus suaedae]